MLTRATRAQLAIFAVATIVAAAILGWYYMSLPKRIGLGRYTVYATLPSSGGLYATANVTYRGISIGKVTRVEPTEQGARVTLGIDDRYKIPNDVTANVHSVSAIGEQYLDLVSNSENPTYISGGTTITRSTVPSQIGPALDAIDRGLSALPSDKIDTLLNETSHAVGGLGPALQRLVESTTTIASDIRDNLDPVNDLVDHTTPILSSQVNSGNAIARWTTNLRTLATQTAQQDTTLRSTLQQAAPTADAITALFRATHDSLPQTLANLEIVEDLLKRYHKGVEQLLVFLPQAAAGAQGATAAYPDKGVLDFALSINQPAPCFSGFVPASQWRAPADTTTAPLPDNTYCKIPKDATNVVRGSRNFPCADVPGKRAATPKECRSNEPYEPAGTNPWYGAPNQVLTCPAPAARCDQPVEPGRVIPAPTINNGMNPLPANLLPGTPPPVSDQLSTPKQGTVTCDGQQPNLCHYTDAPASATYDPLTRQVVTVDGAQYRLRDSSGTGEEGWKEMLSPCGSSTTACR